VLVECDTCQAVVDAKLHNQYNNWVAEEGIDHIHYFLECPRCHRPFVMSGEKYGSDDDDETRATVFPESTRRNLTSLPISVDGAFREAISCYKAKAYSATAIMCRKSLEAVCDAHAFKKGVLASKLQEMKDKGIIESRLFQWAEALRIAGNQAAHDVDSTIVAQDARDLIQFTEALLEYVFTFRDKFDQFMKRRAATPSSRVTPP